MGDILGMMGGGGTSYPNISNAPSLSTLPNPYTGANADEYGNITQNLISNPYANTYQAGANSAGAAAGTLGNQAFANSGTLSNYASNVMNLGLDPQNALYNQQYYNTAQQTDADLSARGLNNSAAGAGIASNNLNNFNIDWENNQLSRAEGGLSAGSSAYGEAENLGESGVSDINNSGLLPYNASETVYTNIGNALNNYANFLSQGQNYNNSIANTEDGLYNSQINADNLAFEEAKENQKNDGSFLSSLLGGSGGSGSGGSIFSSLLGGSGGSGSGGSGSVGDLLSGSGGEYSADAAIDAGADSAADATASGAAASGAFGDIDGFIAEYPEIAALFA
jgi:hypothetical protein